MIPLRDDVPSRTVPFVTYALIALNGLMFLLELGMGAGLERFFYRAAVVPALFTGDDSALSLGEVVVTTLHPQLGSRVLISMFLHGGWAHILGNMLYLWIFGDNVEDRLGHLRYLLFYLLCGWGASYAHIWADPASGLPSIGASGAIGGVLGGYITLYPRARVVTLLPLGLFAQLVQLAGALSLAVQTAATGGVAWWAHIGGFLAGLALVRLLARPERRPPARDQWWEDRYRGRSLRGW
jgi:membrane associated rhomboid family serine protease